MLSGIVVFAAVLLWDLPGVICERKSVAVFACAYALAALLGIAYLAGAKPSPYAAILNGLQAIGLKY